MKNKFPMRGIVLSTRENRPFTDRQTGEVKPATGRFDFAIFNEDEGSWDVLNVKCSIPALTKLNALIFKPEEVVELSQMLIEVNAYSIGKNANREANAGVTYTLIETQK